MLAPNAEQIETAAEQLKRLRLEANGILLSQYKELKAFGPTRANEIGALEGLSSDLALGYELGLQVARVVISQSIAISQAGIKPEEVL